MPQCTYLNKRVVVMGLGRFGGGVGVARFFAGRGANVLVTDTSPPQKLCRSIDALDGLPIEFRLGEHRKSDFAQADLVVVNPAVDGRDNIFLHAATDAGAALTSEIQLLVANLPSRGRTIGVTGTAGKSTVTAMIGHILSRRFGPGRVHVGGNIGGSLLEKVDAIGSDDWVVLELSSFMLELLRSDAWSPHVAVITNFAPNHLDRHGTSEAYQAAKQTILDHQADDMDKAVLGPGLLGRFRPRVQCVKCRSGGEVDGEAAAAISLPGEHNRSNALLAGDVVEAAVGLARCEAVGLLDDFRGLPHRLQFVAEHGGVRYFNDSKSTTAEAAVLAIESFGPGVVHVIMGGYDKKSDLSAMARCAAERCRAVYTIGATGDGLAAACEAAGGEAAIVRCGHVEQAVRETVGRVRSGDVVLLSPGCASWDQFDNYEARGAAFIEALLQCTGEGARPPGAADD